jgi:hypothetical protein
MFGELLVLAIGLNQINKRMNLLKKFQKATLQENATWDDCIEFQQQQQQQQQQQRRRQWQWQWQWYYQSIIKKLSSYPG